MLFLQLAFYLIFFISFFVWEFWNLSVQFLSKILRLLCLNTWWVFEIHFLTFMIVDFDLTLSLWCASTVRCWGLLHLILDYNALVITVCNTLLLLLWYGHINWHSPFQYYVELVSEFAYCTFKTWFLYIPALMMHCPGPILWCFNLLHISSKSLSLSFLSLKNWMVRKSGTKEDSKSLTVLCSKGFRRISIAT